MEFVADSKCHRLFSKSVSASWAVKFKSYSSRAEDFLLHSQDLFFLDKTDGTITTGPSIEMPEGGYKFDWAQDTPDGMIFLAQKQLPNGRSFMISGPTIVEKSNYKIADIVWKNVPPSSSSGIDWDSNSPTKQINRKYLLLSWSKFVPTQPVPHYTIFDHSGPEVVALVTCEDFLSPRDPTLDTKHFVTDRGIFDLSQGGKCVFKTNPNSIRAHAISESYICLITLNSVRLHCGTGPCKPSKIEIWSKVLGRLESSVELDETFCPKAMVILVDQVVLVLGDWNFFSLMQICAIDLKTNEVAVHNLDSISHPWDMLCKKVWRNVLSTPLFASRYNIWDDLHVRFGSGPVYFM